MPSPGTTDPSSDVQRFESQTASIPEVLSGPAEVLPPEGQPAPAAPAPEGWEPKDLSEALGVTFFLLSKRLGEHWELGDDEADRFARAWKPILDRYLPVKESIWAAPILASAAIVGSRALQTDFKKLGDKKPAAQTASTSTAVSTASPPSSGNGVAENQPEWEPFADSRSA